MPTLETSIQLPQKIELLLLSINDLASSLPALGRRLALEHARAVLESFQEQYIHAVLGGLAELVCERCGVVHSGGGTLLRRGSRPRKVRTKRCAGRQDGAAGARYSVGAATGPSSAPPGTVKGAAAGSATARRARRELSATVRV